MARLSSLASHYCAKKSTPLVVHNSNFEFMPHQPATNPPPISPVA